MPLPTTGLILHAKASSLSALANGDPVSSWANQVGGSPLTGTGATRPTYDTSAGVPAVKFNAAHYLALPDLGTLGGITIAFRIRAITGAFVEGDLFNGTSGPWAAFSENNGATNNFGIYTGAAWRTGGGLSLSTFKSLVLVKSGGIGPDAVGYLASNTPLSDDNTNVSGSANLSAAILGGFSTASPNGKFLITDLAIYDSTSDATKVQQIIDALEEVGGSTFKPQYARLANQGLT